MPVTALPGGPGRVDDPGRRRRPVVELVARLGGAGLLAASGAIHLDLYLTSYGSIPTIGPLFLAQAVAAVVLALAVAVGRGWLGPLAGALLTTGTLGGYVVALLVPLFGFREVPTAAGMVAAAVEVAGAGLLAVAAGLGGGVPVGAPAAALVAGASLAVALALEFAGPVVPAGSVVVTAVTVPGYGRVLASRGGDSYYLLSSEAGGRLVCRGVCLSIWPPVLVRNGARPVGSAAGVDGRLGAVRRSNDAEQVTYNGYPLYGYAGDRGRRASSGEGIDSFGGIWYLVRASARTPGATPVVRRTG